MDIQHNDFPIKTSDPAFQRGDLLLRNDHRAVRDYVMRRKKLSKQLRFQVLARDNNRCTVCGRSAADGVTLHIDHIKPFAEGGTDELTNLATLCRDCNLGKSDLRFSDYTQLNPIPQGIEAHFRFIKDPKLGDFEQYHLYLYYKNGIHPGAPDDDYHHVWRISGTRYKSSSDPQALEQRRRKEETQVFLQTIREQLASEGKRLVINEEGVCKL